MEKTRHRVNAKAFVENYRAGMSAEDLMKTHRLTESGLDKLTKVLIRRGLLAPADVAARESLPPLGRENPEHLDRTDAGDGSDRNPSTSPGKLENEEDSLCPQCRAKVSAKALICPECGHVLPGEERWASVEPAKRLTERIPPKILGIVLALPLALLLFFLFRDLFIPAAEDMIDRRSGVLRQKTPRSEDSTADPVVPAEDSIQVLEEELNGLIVSDVISSYSNVDGEYRKLVVGSAWFGFGSREKEQHLSRIRALMIRSGVEVNFEVVDFWGQQVARVTDQSIDFSVKEGGSDADNSPEESKAPPKPPPPIEEVLQGLKQGLPERGSPQ